MRPDAGSHADWLIRTPIAHRGLHDRAAGRIENSPSAARAAAEAGYAIECDVQRSRDGEAMVFHDDRLHRLTGVDGRVDERMAVELGALQLLGTDDRIIALTDFLRLVEGRVPVICEIKSAFDGDLRLTDRVAEIAGLYEGQLALKSFDPAVIVHLRQRLGSTGKLPLGIVAEAAYDHPEWAFLDDDRKKQLAALTHLPDTRPDFLSFHVGDLPHAAATLFRPACHGPVLSWTVRTAVQRTIAETWADQMIFEGFRPD